MAAVSGVSVKDEEGHGPRARPVPALEPHLVPADDLEALKASKLFAQGEPDLRRIREVQEPPLKPVHEEDHDHIDDGSITDDPPEETEEGMVLQ